MKEIGEKYQGKDYDIYFEWSNDRIYCSELVWKIFDRALGVSVGELESLGEFDLSSPVVQQKVQERWGEPLPLDEPVISPASMFESDLLEEVHRE